MTQVQTFQLDGDALLSTSSAAEHCNSPESMPPLRRWRGVALLGLVGIAGCTIVLGVRSRWVSPTVALQDAESVALKAEKTEDPPGCCSYKGHTECAKPWENCQTGLGGDCCSGVDMGIEVCEKCQGEWINLPQNACDHGHSLEKPLPHVWNYSATGNDTLKLKVLSYNLFWWHLFVKLRGDYGKAGKLINRTSKDLPYDILAFQECQNPYHVLYDAGLDKTYTAWRSHENTCLAYRKETWEEIGHGTKTVAIDGNVKGQNFGARTGMWMRLRHKRTNETIFFVNHHGPLPLSSGGQWGAPATAYNLLHLVESNGTKGEVVVMVGDFNSIKTSETITQMGCGIRRILSGTKFGGVDHIFTNLEDSRIISADPVGQGGSDHDALAAVFDIGPERTKAAATTAAATTDAATTAAADAATTAAADAATTAVAKAATAPTTKAATAAKGK